MYNTPIFTPEDRVEQAIDTSDDYPGVYGTPANDLICDPKSDYWIEDVKNEDLIGVETYNIYKGPFPNKEEIIMTCSKEVTKGAYCSIDELVFRHKGIVQAELRCEKEDTLEKYITFSLRSQQKELGLVYKYHGIDTINYYPFFRLVTMPMECWCKIKLCFALSSLLMMLFSIGNLIRDPSIITLLIATTCVGIFLTILFRYSCKCCAKDGVTRWDIYGVIDMNTYEVVAKVYRLDTLGCNQSHYREFSCHREMTRSQLMGLFSLVMLSNPKIPSPPD